VYKYTDNPRIIVFGHKPSWYSGEYIPIREGNSKFANIHNAVTKISQSETVSNNFVLMNDDFYLLQPYNGTDIYHGGLLIEKIAEYKRLCKNLAYVQMLQKTYDKLVAIGIESPLDYDIHVPFPMNKLSLQQTIQNKTLYRSTYGNLCNLGGTEIKDVKVYSSGSLVEKSFDYTNNPSAFISSLDESFDKLLNDLLKEEFTYASPVESAAKVFGNAS
jgi:hypothetical protein